MVRAGHADAIEALEFALHRHAKGLPNPLHATFMERGELYCRDNRSYWARRGANTGNRCPADCCSGQAN